MTDKKIMFPARFMVKWATGDVPCCEPHARALVRLGAMLGNRISTYMLNIPTECTNCVNENKSDDKNPKTT